MAAFNLNQEDRNGVQVLRAHGRLTLGEGASTLRETIESVVAGNPTKIVLDLTDVSYVDSAGLGALVAAYTFVTSRGGRLVLAGLQKRVLDLLQTTKLDKVFEVFDNAEKAAGAMHGSPAD